jgi:hypothetical protein
MEPNWNVTPEEKPIIDAIVARAAEMFPERERTDIAMDIVATHNHACQLRLADLLAADSFNFVHDIVGIGNRLDRETLTLTRGFWPRFAAPDQSGLITE